MAFGRNHIPHNRPTFGIEEEKAAINVLRSGWVAQGTEVENLENEFCDYLGLPRGLAVAVSSGTAALYLALLALGAKERTVLIPAYSCSALRNATALVGGNALVVDSELDSPNMNMFDIDTLNDITILPHMYGIPQDIPKHLYSNKKIIEDCAQALGASINHIPVGLHGNIGVYSFYATKMITSGGQGGMVVSKDPAIVDFLKDYRLFDQRKDEQIRFNFQMSDLQAAIGRVQLRKLPSFLNRRSEIYNQYKKAGFPLLDAKAEIQPVRFRAILQSIKQNELVEALRRESITAVIPLETKELLGPKEHYKNAYYWTKNTVSLPIYPTLTDEEVSRIIKAVTNVL